MGIACVSNIDSACGLSPREIEEKRNACVPGHLGRSARLPDRGAPNFVLPLLTRIGNVLVGYQEHFGEIDNRLFFADWEQTRPDIAWKNLNSATSRETGICSDDQLDRRLTAPNIAQRRKTCARGVLPYAYSVRMLAFTSLHGHMGKSEEVEAMSKYSPSEELIWTPPMIARFWDYEKKSREEFFTYQVGRVLVRHFRGFLSKSKKIVDYGAGPGFLIEELLHENRRCAAVEFSPDAVKLVQSKFQDNSNFLGAHLVGSLQEWNGQFDARYSRKL